MLGLVLVVVRSFAAAGVCRSAGVVQVEPPQGRQAGGGTTWIPLSTGGSWREGEAGSWSGCLPPGCQQLLVSRWRHLLAGRVAAPGVVVLDPGRHRCAGLFPGGEVLHSPQLEFEGGVPRFDDRVVQSRPG